MRIVIIGGTGHVGTYLVPRLVETGHHVIVISRSRMKPYLSNKAWDSVEHLTLDRGAAELEGTFAEQVLRLRPDVLVDMICFTLESARHLSDRLQGNVRLFLSCGTIWVHGHSVEVPTDESQPRRPFGEYGIQKAEIEKFLLNEAERKDLPAAVLHPGHIVHSPNCSIAKAQRLLSYQPRYTSLEAVYESITWLTQNGELRV